jgi:hypothetical protein
MTFPTIPTVAAGRVLTTVQANTTATRTFPSLSGLTKNSGDLLIAIAIAYQSSVTNAAFSSWGGGFTEFHDSSSSTTMAIGIAYKWSDGSETGTFTVTQAATVTGHCALILLSIPGAHLTTPPEAGSRASGTTTAANSGSFNPAGWGTEDTLWIAVGGSGETSTTGSFTGLASAPTNYSNYVDTGISSDVVGGVEGAVAFRQLNAASEDVGAFSVDVSNARSAEVIIAVRGVPVTGTAAITEGADDLDASGNVGADDSETRTYLEVVEYDTMFEGWYGAIGNRVAEVLAAVSGSADITEGDDTSAATGKVSVLGTLSVTEGDDTSSITALLTSEGSAPITEEGDTLSGVGVLRIIASGTILESDDSMSASGKQVALGALSVTEDNDLMSASGGTGLSGSVAVTENNDDMSASGNILVSGTVSVTESSDDSDASGSVLTADSSETRPFLFPDEYIEDEGLVGAIGNRLPQSEFISGSMAVTEGGDSFSATGVLTVTDDPETRPFLLFEFIDEEIFRIRGVIGFEVESLPNITGTAGITEGSDVATVTAKVIIRGTQAVTESNDSMSASGGSGLVGSANITEQHDASSATGNARTLGTLNVQESDDTSQASGILRVIGTVSVNESDDNVNATGKVDIDGTIAVTEQPDDLEANGSVGNVISGSVDVTEQGDSASSTGKVATIGIAAVQEQDDTVTATGEVDISGEASMSEAGDSSASVGIVRVSGSVIVAEDRDTPAITAKVSSVGSLAATSSSDSLTSTGKVVVKGLASVVEADDIASLVGKLATQGQATILEGRDTIISFTLPDSPPAGPRNTKGYGKRRRAGYGSRRIVYGKTRLRTTRRE